MDVPLLLVGCGKMGSALLTGWLGRGVAAANIVVVEPVRAAAEAAAERGVTVAGEASGVDPSFVPRVVVFAVKPQVMDAVASGFAGYTGGETVFLSIAAGTPIRFFESALGATARIVRAMPNTPAAIGRGISVLCANAAASDTDRRLCGDLLAAVGEVAWLNDEGLMDAVTAASGSGPAYVFLLIECLADAAVEAGLPGDLAAQLAKATVEGAAELSRQSGQPAAKLRENVTSPGGTTAAALKILMAPDGLKPLMKRAVAAATTRSRELAG